MSLDHILNDYHTAWQHLIKKEKRAQHQSALREFGADGLQRLQSGGDRVLQRSASAAAVLRVTGQLPDGISASGAAGGAAGGEGQNYHAAATRAMRRQQKVQQAVQERIAEEQRGLRAQIREEASQRKHLLTELRQHRASEPIGPRSAGKACYFKTDPNWELKPLPPSTSRTVVRCSKQCTGLMSFEMG